MAKSKKTTADEAKDPATDATNSDAPETSNQLPPATGDEPETGQTDNADEAPASDDEPAVQPSDDEPDEQDESEPDVEITIAKSMASVVPVYVHGRGTIKIRQGERTLVPFAVVNALESSDCEFEKHDDLILGDDTDVKS